MKKPEQLKIKDTFPILSAIFLTITAIVVMAGILFKPDNLFSGSELYVGLIVIVIFGGLYLFLLYEYKGRVSIGLRKNYNRLGSGYGLVDVMRSAIKRIDEIREEISKGELADEEASTKIEKLLSTLSAYYGDSRWKQVIRMKKAKDEDSGKELAKLIRKDYDL